MIKTIILAIALWGGAAILTAAVLSVITKEVKAARIRRILREKDERRRVGGSP